MLRVQGMDHIVLAVSDVDRSLAWYCGMLGLEPLRVDEWKVGRAPFPSVRVDPATIIDLLPRRLGDGEARGGNLDHFCLVVDPVDFAAVRDSAELDVVEGPVQRWGARGSGTSIYVRDPDGNTVELRYYGD